MADLSALIGRDNPGFARDWRFALAGPDSAPPTGEEPAPDPLALAREAGFAEGLATARAEAAAEAAARGAFAASLARLNEASAEILAQRLRDTVAALCMAALKPLTLDADALSRRIERAVALLRRADDARIIRLHPETLELVRAQIPADWQLSPDPSLEPGAIRVESGEGGIEDGPEHWRAALAEALGAEVLGLC